MSISAKFILFFGHIFCLSIIVLVLHRPPSQVKLALREHSQEYPILLLEFACGGFMGS